MSTGGDVSLVRPSRKRTSPGSRTNSLHRRHPRWHELFDGRARIGKVDVDDQQALAQSYDIRSIPTLLYFVNGEVVERTAGAVAKEMLSSKLNSLVEAA